LVKIATRPTSDEFSINPISIPSLEWWFDNSDASRFSLTGPLVDSQADSGPNGYTRSATGAERPTLTGEEVIYTGNKLLELDKLATMLTYQRGEFFMVAKMNITGIITGLFMTASDSSAFTQIIFVAFESTGAFNNSIGLQVNAVNTLYGDVDLEDDITYHILNWRSDGSNYGMSVDGVEQTINGGTDNGIWFGDDANLDNFLFGAIKDGGGAIYKDITDKESMYFNQILTSANRAGVITYLKDKHGI